MIDVNNITEELRICQHCSIEIRDVKHAYVLTLVNMADEKVEFQTYQFAQSKNDLKIKRVVAVMFHKNCWEELAGKKYSFDASNVERFIPPLEKKR